MKKTTKTYYKIACDICKFEEEIKDRLTAQNIMLGHLQQSHATEHGGLHWMKMIANEYMNLTFIYEEADGHEITNKIEASDIIKFFAIMVQDGDIPRQEWIMS